MLLQCYGLVRNAGGTKTQMVRKDCLSFLFNPLTGKQKREPDRHRVLFLAPEAVVAYARPILDNGSDRQKVEPLPGSDSATSVPLRVRVMLFLAARRIRSILLFQARRKLPGSYVLVVIKAMSDYSHQFLTRGVPGLFIGCVTNLL